MSSIIFFPTQMKIYLCKPMDPPVSSKSMIARAHEREGDCSAHIFTVTRP